MYKLKIIVLSVILLALYGCPDPDINPEYSLYMNNNSKKSIVFCEGELYPDTSLRKYGFNDNNINYYSVDAVTTKVFGFPSSIISQNDKRCYFILDKEIVTSVPWDTIQKNYIVLKRYDLSLEDFKKLNWSLIYP